MSGPSKFDSGDLTVSKRLCQADLWAEIGQELPARPPPTVLMLAGPRPQPEIALIRHNLRTSHVTAADCDPALSKLVRECGGDEGLVGRIERLSQRLHFDCVHLDLAGNLRGADTLTTIRAGSRLAEKFLAVTLTYAWDDPFSMQEDGLASNIWWKKEIPEAVFLRALRLWKLVGKKRWEPVRIYQYRGSENKRFPMMCMIFARPRKPLWDPFFVDDQGLKKAAFTTVYTRYGPLVLSKVLGLSRLSLIAHKAIWTRQAARTPAPKKNNRRDSWRAARH